MCGEAAGWKVQATEAWACKDARMRGCEEDVHDDVGALLCADKSRLVARWGWEGGAGWRLGRGVDGGRIWSESTETECWLGAPAARRCAGMQAQGRQQPDRQPDMSLPIAQDALQSTVYIHAINSTSVLGALMSWCSGWSIGFGAATRGFVCPSVRPGF